MNDVNIPIGLQLRLGFVDSIAGEVQRGIPRYINCGCQEDTVGSTLSQPGDRDPVATLKTEFALSFPILSPEFPGISQ